MNHLDRSRAVCLAGLLVFSAPALAADTCRVKAVLGGKPVTMTHCAAAVYEGEHSVTLWFSDAPFSAKEIAGFQESSSPSDKTADGKSRTLIHFAFCPGAGQPAASAASVKSVETGINVAGAPFSGRQWVLELPKDKEILKIAKLSGTAAPGGKLSGLFTGGKVSDGLKYSWEAAFDVTLPAKSAFGGVTCGK
jgi:hypothetical protein